MPLTLMTSTTPHLPVGYTARRARHHELSELVEVLGGAVPDCLPETVWQLPWSWPHYILVRDERGEIVATGSLQPVDARRAEIRGLYVAPSARGKGVAKVLVRLLQGDARRQGREVVCVTKKPGFFRRLGFHATPSTWLDSQRRAVPTDGPQRVGMKAPPQSRPSWGMQA